MMATGEQLPRRIINVCRIDVPLASVRQTVSTYASVRILAQPPMPRHVSRHVRRSVP